MATLNVAGTQVGATTLTGVKGKTAQYQIDGKQGGTVKGLDSGNIKIAGQPGTYNSIPGASVGGTGTGISGTEKLTDATIQRSTDPLVIGQAASNVADNFLASTTGSGLVPTVNPAQAASAGKSLAPQHE